MGLSKTGLIESLNILFTKFSLKTTNPPAFQELYLTIPFP